MTNSLIEKQIVIKLQQLNAQQQQKVLNFTKNLVNQDDCSYLIPKLSLINSAKPSEHGLEIETIEELKVN